MLTRFRPTFHLHPATSVTVSLEEYSPQSKNWDSLSFSEPASNRLEKYVMYTNERDVDIAGVRFKDLLYMVLYPWNFGPKVFWETIR
jgi:hypothetical protein